MLLSAIFQLLIPLVTLIAGSYVLIIAQQNEQRRRTQLINQFLRPGVMVQTASGLHGVAVFITHNTIIIELATGQKVEVLKQTVTDCAHGKLT